MLLNYFFVLGGIQGFILTLIVYSKKRFNHSNIFLAAFLFFLGLGCLLDNSLNLLNFNLFIIFWCGNEFLFAPILYLYVYSEVYQKNSLNKKYIHHIYIFVIIKIIVLFSHFSNIIPNSSWAITGKILNLFLIIYNFTYLYYSFKLLSKDSFSTRKLLKTERLLKMLLWVFAFYNIVFFVRRFLDYFNIFRIDYFEDYLYVGVSIIIYIIGIFIMYLPNILTQKPKYFKSLINTNEVSLYGKKIETYLKSTKVYTNPLFNLQALANELNIPKHKVSQIIGEYFETTFHDLLNRYRIEEVSKIITSEQKSKMNIFGIAMDCGYQSKSAFYTAFRKNKGVTPSEFIKLNKISSI